MTDDRNFPSGPLISRAPAFIGPLFRDDAVTLRYGAAIVVVLAVAGDAAESMRALLRTEGHEVEVLHDGAAALTGYGREEDRNAALKAGFDGHLAKPVDPRRLLQIVTVESQSKSASKQSG